MQIVSLGIKCQILFSRKRNNKKNIISLSSAEFAHTMASVKDTILSHNQKQWKLCSAE